MVAVAALGGAFAAVRGLEAQRLGKARAEAARTAASARQRTADGLRQQLESLQTDATSAAQLQPLIALLGELRRHRLDDQLGATVKDFFGSELSWEPYRKKFKVQGLAAEGERLQVVQGIEARDFAAEDLIR